MNVTLSYQPQLLSPPFAYAAVLELTVLENEIKAKFDLIYLHRELISIDEIKNEGFTVNDDYSWEGELNLNWKQDIELLSSMETSEKPDEEIYLNIHVNDSNLGFPSKISLADQLFQELMQAVIEKNRLEMPLIVNVRLNNVPYSITWSFEFRTLQINATEESDWEKGRVIMESIYGIDFGMLKPGKKPSVNCVEVEGFWYPLPDRQTKDLYDLLSVL